MAKKSKNDQVPTPVSYVEDMLDRIGYRNKIVGKKVLENSCGQGNILVSVVKRYILDAKEQGLSYQAIVVGLQQDIIAFDTDEKQIEVCIRRLDDICAKEGIPKVRWNISNQDFLKYDVKQINASYVIGNPPYITYHDIKEEDRKFLQEHFTVCKKGRFDYCYAFIEASINSMSLDGKMIYLIPFSIFRNRYAENLRKFLKNEIINVVDFSGRKVFPGITCSSAFLICEKGNCLDYVIYDRIESGERIIIEKKELSAEGKKWVFQNTTSGKFEFGDYFNVYNSVATLLNEAFLFYPESETADMFCTKRGMIEKNVCLPAISTKSKKREDKTEEKEQLKQQYIIFPYKIKGKTIDRFAEEEFRNKYPQAYVYLSRFKEKLENRTSDKNIYWFEYGRGQLLNALWEEKLVMPMVVTKQAKVYKAGDNTVPYAGYFITQKKNSNYTLKDAEKILKSKAFYQYVKDVGTPTTETSYRVSVDDIKRFKFE